MDNKNKEFLKKVNIFLEENKINLTPKIVKKSIFSYLEFYNEIGVLRTTIKIKSIVDENCILNKNRTQSCHTPGVSIYSEQKNNKVINPYSDTIGWLNLFHDELKAKPKNASQFKFF